MKVQKFIFIFQILILISNVLITKEISDIIEIEINIDSEIEKIYELSPSTSITFNLNNNSLAYFIESSIEDLIYYESNPCPKFCAIKNDEEIKHIYINHKQILTSDTKIKLTAKSNVNAVISSSILDSAKESGIYHISDNTNIQIFQFTEKNYLYGDSYDNYVSMYFGEYNEGISISDIININKDIFKERHGEIIELDTDIIYIIFFVSKYSFYKFYLYNDLPQENYITNGDNDILYLKEGNNYILNFESNTMPFIIKLNPIKNSTIDIISDTTQKTLTAEDKYFYPDEINSKIRIENIFNENALIEILFSFEEEDTEIINEISVENKIITKNVTLIEYLPQNENKNLEIFINSDDDFKISAYGGPSKDIYFYYSTHANTNYLKNVKKYFIKLENPMKNIKYFEEDEIYYISLIFYKSKENQEIKLSYYYNSNPLYDLYEDLEEDYINNVISNLTSILRGYVYIEIAQNPPQPQNISEYNHNPIDLIESLNNIPRSNIKFYDFYREMREILGTVRDLHFRIFGLNTPKGIKLDQITACLPFSFYVSKDENNIPKMYIKYFESCGVYFTQDERNYIKERSEKIPLKYINNKDPFDYVQEWGRKYRGNKSPHAHFTLMKTLIHSFYIRLYPYTPDELKMTFEFESPLENDIINLDYYIFIPNVQTVQKLYSNININFDQEDFDKYFKSQLEKNYKSQNAYEPNIFEVIEEYNILKGYIKEKKKEENEIEWTYKTPEENGIKCRVDDKNEINIFVQQSFSIDEDKAQEVMYNCTRDFYKNNYRIIGIQNRDGGGWANLCLIFHQLVQVKTQDRAFKASRISEFFKNHVLEEYDEIINVNTCKPFNNIDDLMTEIIDDFSTKDKQLLHHRSQVFNYIDKDTRKKLRDIRKEFMDYGHLKRPTDIIIYTDSFSYSATSSFIKGFQYQGGAIIVGFNGNPFIEKEQFDGSQSPASVTTFESSDEYKNLNKLGIVVSGITWAETYDDYYIKENPIPREYLLDPVDERVDIYEPYTDDKYQLFIDKAKEIFDKYNEKGECNNKNKKLTLDPMNENECYSFDDDVHAHGGYECNEDGKWSNVCRKYYCDLGYYYNVYKGRCERDICANDENEEDIYLKENYENIIKLNSDNNKEYIFHINNSDYIYIFENVNGEEGYIHYGYNISCPKLCVVQYGNSEHKNKIHLNYYRNATGNNIIIKISSIKNYNGNILSLKTKDSIIDNITPLILPKNILIFEPLSDYILYTRTIDNRISIKKAEYIKEISINDILNINEKYFDDFDNEITVLNQGKMYILAIASETEETYNKPYEILLQPKIIEKELIEINENNFIYITQEKEYILDFNNNKNNTYIELSRLTLDSELIIKEMSTGKETLLNKDNIYYKFDETEEIFKGKLLLKIKNSKDALINFIYKCNETETEILEEKEYIEHKISKSKIIIKFDNNIKNKYIKITVLNNEKEMNFSISSGFGINNYIKYSKLKNSNKSLKKYSKTDIIIYNSDDQLEKDEYFYLFLLFENEDIKSDSILITKTEKLLLDDLNPNIPDEKCKSVIDNIKKLIEEGYVYTDIIKNPPNPEYFCKVDLISELNEVKTKKRKYYDFFRDIRRILGKMKDGHLNIIAKESPNSYEIKKLSMCLPFSFIINGNNPSTVEMGIKKYEDCFYNFDNKTQKFVEEHTNINIDKINGSDPFDFIQNLQIEFNAIHNKHGQFTRNINAAHKLTLSRNPLRKNQFENIEFLFKDGQKIKLDYYLYFVKEDKELNNDYQFLDFYNEEIRKEINTLNEISILDIKNKYNKKISNFEEENEIEWDYYTTNKDDLKCRVDTENQVNIFVQKTFNFLDDEYNKALEVINNCTEAFYNNSYPIIGIESNNGGGIIEVSLYFQQFLQVKILQRTHFSAKISELMKKEMEKDNMTDIIDFETCTKFNSFDEMKEIIDDYGKDEAEKDIKHHRTKIFELFNKTVLKEHKERRKKYFENYKLKKPTDIIIFTDSFSYSSTSFFIKGLQETGAAILVGYNGNPKSDEFFEASHSPSAVSNFNGSDVYDNLLDAGFEIIGTTFFESYNYSYQIKNPTPREYLTHPVDERVNLYQSYDDSIYQQFIDEAKVIFKKYNEENGCNPNNKRLLYDPNNKIDCYNFKDEHAHGGFVCDINTKKWSDICVPYYCDIGYYFDIYQNKCIIDKFTEEVNDDDKTLPIWIILVIAISVAVVIAVIVIIVVIRLRSKKKEDKVDLEGSILQKSRGSEVQ